MIATQGVKYIGSKNKLTDYILRHILADCPDINSAIDVFTGTTRVAQALRLLDIPVHTSDLSWASEAYAKTFVHGKDNQHLQPYIDELNAIEPAAGWLTEKYCDVVSPSQTLVRVWQPKNGMKADAIRDRIDEFNLEPWEKMTLITSLIFALDAVDNTVGVQQAYLKQWCKRSHNDLTMKLPASSRSIGNSGQHFVGDALTIDYPQADLAYLDPPYSPHSYASYYHIWDSIVRWDKPEVGLNTNRRIDRVSKSAEFDDSFASPWNRKGQALDAFERLIDRLPVKYCLLSYSNDSLVPTEDLVAMSETKGEVTITEIDYKRNVMCKIGNHSDGTEIVTKNKELLIMIKKDKGA